MCLCWFHLFALCCVLFESICQQGFVNPVFLTTAVSWVVVVAVAAAADWADIWCLVYAGRCFQHEILMGNRATEREREREAQRQSVMGIPRIEAGERFGDLHWQPNCANCPGRLLFWPQTVRQLPYMPHMPHVQGVHLHFKQLLATKNLISPQNETKTSRKVHVAWLIDYLISQSLSAVRILSAFACFISRWQVATGKWQVQVVPFTCTTFSNYFHNQILIAAQKWAAA